MLIRLLILCAAIVLISLLLRLHKRFQAAPPWLRILHHAVFFAASAYLAVFAVIFAALHVFGYRL
ncbi:MAG: DUF4175 domain-containing protein [Alphaproteobacteria bacterium]|nr:MAG: DUF4175 domain-containing protein [Alphaproteobacteria bacterium]TMJ40580.1 MAG: DUF4175 domain-containing protein [Alphaproteobacteria bacterium]